MPLTVALIAGGGFQGQGIIEAIHAMPDARVVVIDSTRDAVGELCADRYVVAPAFDAATFDEFLVDLVRSEGVALVIPATQRELRRLALIGPRLREAGARTAVCPPALLDVLLDKRALYMALEESGIAVQRCMDLKVEAPFPLFGRPRAGWGGRGSMILRMPSDLRAEDVESLSRSHVWVPWLESFDELSIDFAVDFQGRASPQTVRRRVRTSGGFAVVSDSENDAIAALLLDQLVHWLVERGACGLFNVQVLRTPDAGYFVSDINPRHGTSSGHALAEGNNLVGFLLDGPAVHMRQPVRTVRSLAQQAIPLFEPGSIGGVVFDLDDTLIDHKRWIFDRMRLAAARLEGRVETQALLLQTYMALEQGEHAQLIDVIVERLGDNSLHQHLLDAYRAVTPERGHVFPEVVDVLRALRVQGLKLALLTDNPPAAQRAKLAACGALANAFDLLVFSREHGGEKPARASFDAVASGLGLSAGRLLMVGDNPARDALGSMQAGWRSCLLVDRPGGRYRLNRELLDRVAPTAGARIWAAADLRVLPLALRLAHANEEK
jgi:HAD superfamily hydrolase (TIGR01549 family)